MSMYNAIFGVNPLTPILLAALNLNHKAVPRFRDCYLAEDGTQIAVYTRMGGGNRGHWDFWTDDNENPCTAGPECPCPGCVAEYKLAAHSQYIRDEDDDFDCTYATYYFDTPPDCIELFREIAFAHEQRDPQAMQAALIKKLESHTPKELENDPQVQHMAKVLSPVIEKMREVFEESEGK